MVRAAWAVTTAAASFTWSDLGDQPDDPYRSTQAFVTYPAATKVRRNSNCDIPFPGHFPLFLSTYHVIPHAPWTLYFNLMHLSDAGWCLQSDAAINSRLQAIDVLNRVMSEELPAFERTLPADELLGKPVPDLTFCLAEYDYTLTSASFLVLFCFFAAFLPARFRQRRCDRGPSRALSSIVRHCALMLAIHVAVPNLLKTHPPTLVVTVSGALAGNMQVIAVS